MTARPLSVVHFCNTPARGGAEEHILTLLRGLDRNRFRLHFVCTPMVAEHMRHDIPAEVELLPLDLRRPWHVRSALHLAHFLNQRRTDILHVHQFRASVLSAPVARLLARVPVIVETPHLRESWRQGWKAYHGIDRFFSRFVDHYIAVSEANARYLRDQKGVAAGKITVILNGTDVNRYDPHHFPPAGFRSSIGIEEDDPVLLVLARLELQKGHRVLIEAMAAVHRAYPKAKLFCLGEGSLRGELQAYANSLGLSDVVHFPGYCRNIEDWLALADFTVLPSLFEGLPLVAAESLAAGRTMVATAVDGTPEIVVDGQTGLIVPPQNPAALAGAICRLLGDPDLRRKLAAAGRPWVTERFDERLQVQRTEELYVQLWEHRSRLRSTSVSGILV